jgi:hypothetical protein
MTEKNVRKGMNVMNKAILSSLGILIIACLAGAALADDPFAVGEKWIYQHEGAVPMRPPDYAISGDRIREVVAVQGEDTEKRWLILEAWGEDDEWAGKRVVSAERMYDKIDSGEGRVMTIDPAYPYDYLNLKPGEEKKWESTFKFSEEWSFPMKLTAKRIKDVTLKVPAGEFENCIHIQSEESVTFSPPDGNEMTITTKREQWYHPKVNGLVKEIYILGRPDGSEEKGVSELKSYAKEKKE